jgi:hypothetical protein
MAPQVAQLAVDLPAAITHAGIVGLTHSALSDEGAVVKTALSEALQGTVVRPWRVERQVGRTVIVLGYTDQGAAELQARLQTALPTARQAVQLHAVAPAIEPRPGMRLSFDVRLAPVVHVTGGREGVRPGYRDAYLQAVDLAGGRLETPREAVYAEYLANRLPGARVLAARLTGLRIPRLSRKGCHGQWERGRASRWRRCRGCSRCSTGRR